MKIELQDNALFRSVGQKILQSDILNKEPERINSRISVFSKGQSVSSLYLLIEGKIKFINFNFINHGKDENQSRTILAGEFFGYEEIVTGKKRNSTAITLTDCEIFEITVNELNSLIAQDGQILKNLNRKNSATQTAVTDPEQKEKTTKENKFYFDFRTKVDFAKEKQIKNNAEISALEKPKELLDKEIEEKRALIANTEKNAGTADVQLEQFRKREEELLARINELENIIERKEAESEEKDPAKSSEPKSEIMSNKEVKTEIEEVESDLKEEPGFDYSVNLERDYNLAFQVQEYEDVVIIFVNIQRGVASSAFRFKRTLDKLLSDGKMKIVVDLSFCDFLDSTFLGVLVTLLKKLNDEGGSLRVVLSAIKISSSTFFLSGMDRVFNIQTNLIKAINEILNKDS